MKRNLKYIIAIVVILLIAMIGIIAVNKNKKEKINDGKYRIVTTFYPIYIMTANITQGANNIELVNMADVNVGCIHDYTLQTSDMKKIENADVIIQNGLGLESFMEKAISANKNVHIIDSSKGILNIIKDEDETNAHIWTSTSNYIMQVENIKKELCEKNPENAPIYEANAKEYIKKLSELKLKFETDLQQLNGQSAVVLNESFEYLARDIGLNATTIKTSHEESTLSAETLKNIINDMKEKNTKIIIVDKDDDLKNAQTISNETGAKIYTLDSAITGALNKESYIKCMNANFDRLSE